MTQRKREKQRKLTAQGFLPVKRIEHGVIETTDGRYLKILEIEPINFMLRSDEEQFNIISTFASWLKISPMRLQFKSITRKADSDRHVAMVRRELEHEENDQCKSLGEGYIRLIKDVGSREALTRRFFLIFQYEELRRGDSEDIGQVYSALQTAEQNARAYFLQCGNSIVQPADPDEATAEILYMFFNRHSCVDEPFSAQVNRVVLDTMAARGKVIGIDPVPKINVAHFLAPRGIDLTHFNYSVMDSLYYAFLYIRGKSVVVFEDLFEGESKVASHADIEDEGQTITFTKPKIGTTATVGGEHTAQPVGEITIIDTVKYSGLVPGKEYTVKGVLMDKSTGKPLTVEGKEITAEATFRASNAEGTIDIPFTLDASALAGKTVVAFETLYRDKLEVCAHADIEDEDQTVTFSEKPEIKTTATVNGEKKAEPKGEVTIKDTVSYTGLTPGKTYKLSGVLMDKSSGAALLVDGQKVSAEKEFTPENASGSVEITFTFDASAIAGKSVVVFETLYHEGKEVAVHADITDEGQTVEFEKPDEPQIKTTATANGEKKAEPVGEVTIKDTVSYTGLTPGKTYKLSGVLMDKSSGAALLVDGQKVTAEKEFTPENSSGSVEIDFTFDASAIAGKSVVVFETLYHDNKEVAVHADITDKDQTVEFEEPDKPQIRTKATVDGEKEVDPLEKVTLTDTVTFSNLTPGKNYTVKGVLMDKSTGKKLLIDGKEVTAETEFTPDKADGTVDLSFTFDASGLAGKSIVAFETLYHEDVEVAVHADIDDDDQTVVIRQPKLKTTATIGGKKEVAISKELVLEDKVAYTGLTPGKGYTVKGVLMDKTTGKKFLVDGKEITAEAAFTPDKSEGEVTVTFKFDGSKITARTDVVVFETLYCDGKEIAAHTDINDEGQTVTLNPEKPKKPTPDVPKTGDGRSILLPLILLGGSIAGLLALLLFWSGRKKSSSQTGSEKDQ